MATTSNEIEPDFLREATTDQNRAIDAARERANAAERDRAATQGEGRSR